MQCRVCHSKKLIKVLSLGSQYLADFRDDNKKPPKYPLDLILCQNCFLVQLKESVPATILYNDRYGYYSGINEAMVKHLKEIVIQTENISQIKPSERWVDIGCNDLTTLKAVNDEIERIGFDPVNKFTKYAEGTNIEFINDYFNKEAYHQFFGSRKAKVISAISCFYDIEDPNAFLSDIKDILAEDGVFVVQQNYLVAMILQNAFDNICHEHIEFYSLLSLENLLRRHDLEVFQVELNDLNGGSFRTFICHEGARKTDNSVFSLRESEKLLQLGKKDVYQAFGKRIKEIAEKIHNFVKHETEKGKTIYCYGASTRGNTLLQACNLDEKLIKKAVDRNSVKWGKKYAGIGIPIVSEEEGREEKPDILIILPWWFEKMFRERETEYLKNGGIFLVPLPTPILVTKENL